jgi:hypothetical protein
MKMADAKYWMVKQRNTRPHPSPLPQERENHSSRRGEEGAEGCSAGFTANGNGADEGKDGQECSMGMPGFSLSPGERAGVRAGLCLISLLLFSLSTRAQSFTVDWFTIDGGGGTSTGGVYSVSGTMGQPDAGKMSGGNFSIDGGFWGIIAAVPTPGAPRLTVLLTPTNTALVSWPSPSTGFILQQNTNLNTTNWVAPAEAVSDNGTSKFILVKPPSGNRFFRLRNP